MKLTKQQLAKLGELHASAVAIRDQADAAGRPMTGEELSQFNEIMDRYDSESASFEAANRLGAAQDRLGKMTEAANEPNPRKALDLASEAVGRDLHAGAGHGSADPEVRTFAVEGRNMRPVALQPGSSLYERASSDYQAGFSHFLKTGQIDPSANLQISDAGGGGVLAPMQVTSTFMKFLDDLVWMRSLATVLPPIETGGSIGQLTLEDDPSDSEWTSEVPATALTADSDMKFGRRELIPHLLSKQIKVSMSLMQRSVVPMEPFIASRLAHKHATGEEVGFMTGSGANQPLGIFTASNDGIPTSRDVTAASSSTITADEVINTAYSIKSQYMPNASWVLHRDVLKTIRKLKDGEGQYLWSAGLADGSPGTILGRPYYVSEFAPNTFTTGQYMLAFGDFKQYVIADAMTFRVQTLVERFADQNQVGFIGRKETDGMPIVAAAFARLVLA